jgi:Ca2+-binding EF-hand superfamily protein
VYDYSQAIRDIILDKLSKAGDPEKELRHLFAEIDIDGEGTLRYATE